jgi:co-chaperonin GroES (HSP10)
MITPTKNRILVKMSSRYDDRPNPLNLQLVDKQKHWMGVRKGRVEAVGPLVREVNVGDTVLFSGDDGFTLDSDGHSEYQDSDNSWRWLTEKDCMAVEEPVSVNLEVVGGQHDGVRAVRR